MKKNKLLWKTLKDGLVSTRGNHRWKIGKWHKVRADKLEICDTGFHASERILDAFRYVKPGCVARVEVRGESITHSDKQCWSEMRIVKAWKWTKNDSVAMAVYAAELVLHVYEKRYPHDKRPRNAIDAARRWVKHPTEKNRLAADAAYAAALTAVYAAAYAAALTAADAAYAAHAAADAADEDEEISTKIETWLRRRINRLEEIK